MEITELIGCNLFESENYGGWKILSDKLIPTIRASKVCTGIIEIIKVDIMYEKVKNSKNRTEQNRTEQNHNYTQFIGSLNNHGPGFAGAVFDSNFISPTLTTMQGGGREPHTLEIKKLGNVYNDEKFTGGEYDGNVWDSNGIAPTMKTGASASQQCVVEIKKMGNSEVIGKMLETSNQRYQVYDKDLLCPTLQAAIGTGGGNCPYFVDEKQIVAMRGRNPENPSDRTAGIHLEQRLEPNSENMCNTLTSVQKDNLVLEKDIINPLSDSKDVSLQFAQNVYDEKSTLIRSIKSGEGSGNIPKSITIRQATKNGFVNCEIGGVCDLNYPTSQTRRGRVQENGQVSPTLTTENIPSVIELADPEFYNFLYEIEGDIYLIRIRKLIPLETWRLMGFSDEDFHKAEKVNSNTQLYKQAGNSIVKDVLMAIFKQLI